MSQRRRILFAGSGAFGVPTLRALVAAGFELPLIVSQPDKPAGRGRQLTPTPIARLALDLHLPLLRTTNINLEPLPEADLLVVIAFGQKIAPAVVHHPRYGSINLHASLLPRHRGAAPIHWAILCGDEITGNTVIRLAERMDGGAVLGTSDPRPIGLSTTSELHDLLADDGPAVVLRVIEQLFTGQATETPQDESLATLAPKLSRDAARIDFAQPADLVARRIRAMYDWPGCRVTLHHRDREVARLTLVRAEAVHALVDASPPGTINADGSISAGTGAVRVLEVQPEGGRRMSLDAFRNGRGWDAGMTLRPV
jgi:methionyl-tRNA formyltransferase